MSDTDRIQATAQKLAASHAAGAKFENLPAELAVADMQQAYAVQRALVNIWLSEGQGPVGGYKIALTSKAMQEMVGVDEPCAGILLANNFHQSPATLKAGDFTHMGIEYELAVRLGRDVDGGTQDGDSIRAYVDACMPAFELIEDRGADYSNLNALDLVADNSWNGGVVLGAPSTAWGDLDLASNPVSLDYNGTVDTATTGAAMDNPMNAVAWVANLLAAQGQMLKAGMIVMTGSTLKTKFPVTGDRAVYTVDGLGSVELRMVD